MVGRWDWRGNEGRWEMECGCDCVDGVGCIMVMCRGRCGGIGGGGVCAGVRGGGVHGLLLCLFFCLEPGGGWGAICVGGGWASKTA